MEELKKKLLNNINTPSDLKKLSKSELPELCEELRNYIIDAVSSNPGHFGASLGVIELTVALHYVYNTPYDQLIWDVGHQAYAHKILTGRRNIFHTNRKYKGISGFPKLEEALRQKDVAVQELKNKVANALVGFNNQGLSVYEKDGNVYVSLEERLLFKTGQWDVDPKGQEAIKELGLILAQNPDINIMVEGHTDDVPMNGSGAVKDNWDLSVMRATAVTKIITRNQDIDPKRIISAGRSEYVPIDNEKTAEARQKNRRTEIILTPRINELLDILGTN